MKKINNQKFIALLIAVGAFILYTTPILFLWYPQWHESKHLAFNWPDANANFWSVSRIVDQASIGEFDSLNILSNFLLHTRSQNVIDGVTLPMAFLPGLFIMASLSWLFGQFASLFVVPSLAAAFVLIFYLLISKLFPDKNLAIVSTILLATLGPWFYFATQVLLPNIVVLFLAILALFAFVDKKYIAGSLFFALAIVCRPPEIIWLLPMLVLFFYYLKPQLSKLRMINSFIIFIAIILWALYLNKLVFGGYFLTGYANFQTNALPSETHLRADNILSWLSPFGVNVLLAVKNYIKYFWLLIWPYSIFILLGVWNILKSKNNDQHKKYLVVYVVVSVLLVLYYGSWDFADLLVKNLNTISISYVRYFLPIFVMSVPLVVIGIKYLLTNLKHSNFWQTCIIVGLVLFSANQIIFTANDGWLASARYIYGYYKEYQNIKAVVPAESVIISERSDKYLYPYYRVVVPQGDLELWPRVKSIYGTIGIYYYASDSVEQLAKVKSIMASSQLDLSAPILINGDLTLYQVVAR